MKTETTLLYLFFIKYWSRLGNGNEYEKAYTERYECVVFDCCCADASLADALRLDRLTFSLQSEVVSVVINLYRRNGKRDVDNSVSQEKEWATEIVEALLYSNGPFLVGESAEEKEKKIR